MDKYDFCGWATRNNLKCTDGRTIRQNAFMHNDGKVVPLVWNHQHNDPFNYLGRAMLENRDEGVYAYCTFNSTEPAAQAKELVEHGDIVALSIFANQLKQDNSDVIHGDIKEVSLVLAGANPGAYIESVIRHGEISDEEATIYSGEKLEMFHEKSSEEENTMEHNEKTEESAETSESSEESVEHADKEDEEATKTIGDILDTLNEEQLNAVYQLIADALNSAKESSEEETEEDEEEEDKQAKQSEINEGDDETTMKHNVFDKDVETNKNTLSHADEQAIFADAKRYGSLRDSALAHGITDIDYLFPEATTINNPPGFIQRDTTWVSNVMNAVSHTPFSRIKSIFADLTEDDARAKGYIKGNMKKEEVFSLLKRTTTPTTIYKKQKLDRDDVVDITDFDVVAWLKTEMRTMLDEEIARAILIGDGRLASSDDKINEQNIRPVWTDDDLFTIKTVVPGSEINATVAKAFIRSAIKARKDYKGSGEPTLYTTEDMLTEMLLLEDTTGRVIYTTVDQLRTALRVREIVTVPVMEDVTRTESSDSSTRTLLGLIVNLTDYNVGADKGGAVNMFDDFDIDYNAQKYLIETRCSGAMIKPYSAIAMEFSSASTEVG